MKGCIFCGGTVEFFCDHIIGRRRETARSPGSPDWVPKWHKRHHEPGERISLEDDFITCDAPLCKACAATRGHLSGRDGGRRFHETIDYCPMHCDQESGIVRLMSKLEEKRYRARFQAKAQKRLVEVGDEELYDERPER